jgi:stearoyl-CoA desaturase (delta-9 desaturase)
VENTPLNKLYAVAGFTVSFLGTVVALVLAFRSGIGAVELGLLALMYSVTMAGMTVGYHRYFSHRSFEAHPAVITALAIAGGMAAQGPLLYWAANHRAHHRFTDAPGDPHSPHYRGEQKLGTLRGLWHAHMAWIYRHEVPDAVGYCRELLRSPLLRRLNSLYLLWVALGLALPALLGGLLTGSLDGALSGLLWGGFVRTFAVFQTGLALGSICHSYGSRPFAIRGRAANNALLALQSFGEGWHQNHHAFPSSAIFGFEWWQVDVGGWVIRGLESLGWVWKVKVPTREALRARRSTPDTEDWWSTLPERLARGSQPPP